MHPKPTKRGIARPSRVLAAFLALLLAASGLALAAVPASPAGAALEARTITGGQLVWGVKETFRDYVLSPIADGEIIVADGATQASDNGVFTFPAVAGVGAVEGDDVVAEFAGSVHFKGHFHTYGELVIPLLDMKIENVRVLFQSGGEGVLIADVSSRAFEGTDPVEAPPVLTYEDVELAALNLLDIVPTETTWDDIPAVLTEEGVPAFGDFYEAGEVLDPVTVTVETETTIHLSQTSGFDPAATTSVTVTGYNYDPDANISTRAPVPEGMSSGVYVVFGRFPDVWQPSQGVPSTARKVLSQKWAMPQASIDAVEEDFPGACTFQCVPLNPDGSFEATLQINAGDVPAGGNWGVFTYAGGGAPPNASQEVYEPISFTQVFTDVPQSNAFFGPISWLTEEGIAEGFPDDTFRPEAGLTRQAGAAFLWRMAGEPAAPPGHPTFTDVPVDHPFYTAISWAAAEGITVGFPDESFRPMNSLPRQAVASFLWNDADEPTPPPGHPTFTDVPVDHPFYTAISWLAGVEITSGFSDDTFRPTDEVTRQAMAAFLYRYDNLEPPA